MDSLAVCDLGCGYRSPIARNMPRASCLVDTALNRGYTSRASSQTIGGHMMKKCVAFLALFLVAQVALAQGHDVVVTGGWMFASTGNQRVHNPGILIRAGKLLRVGGDLSIAAPDAERVQLANTETVIPGLFDLHAHYTMDLFNAGRKDETTAYPSLFLANGVTSTWPAGEMNPDSMRALRIRIDRGTVSVNHTALAEPYVQDPDRRSFSEVVVPAQAVYVLGDNRANSEDSRVFGPVGENTLIGRAVAVIWPPHALGGVLYR